MSKFDEKGREILDATPVALPIGYKHPESLTSQIRRLIKNELSMSARAEGKETFEEADDFDTGDDDDIRSPYELDDEQITAPIEKFDDEKHEVDKQRKNKRKTDKEKDFVRKSDKQKTKDARKSDNEEDDDVEADND